MTLLSIDSSAKSASAAIVCDGVLRGEQFVNNGLTHSQTLLPMVKNLLDVCGMTVVEIDTFVVTNGPGSCTGIRIGVAAVKGMAMDKPCVGVSTLLSMAYQLAGCYEGLICAAMDARRDQVYTALFESRDGKIVRLTEDAALSLDELKKTVKKIKKIPIFVGDGAKICYTVFNSDGIPCKIAPELLRFQRAAGAACAFLEDPAVCMQTSAQALSIEYLRLSQAERERKQRNEG